MKTKKLLALAVIATGFLSPLSAMAGPLLTGVQVQSFNFASLENLATLPFNGFNSSLGTLNSVHFNWELNGTLESVVFNSTGTVKSVGNPVPVSSSSTTTFQGSGIAALLTAQETLTTPGFTGSVASNSASTVGTISENRSGGVCLSNDNSCGVGNTDLSGYVGGLNLFNIVISNSGIEIGNKPTGVFLGSNFTANGLVSLSYDYTMPANVPEPVSLSLMGLGLAYLTASRKKRAVCLMA